MHSPNYFSGVSIQLKKMPLAVGWALPSLFAELRSMCYKFVGASRPVVLVDKIHPTRCGVPTGIDFWPIGFAAIMHARRWLVALPSMTASHRRVGSAHHVRVTHTLCFTKESGCPSPVVLVDGIHPTRSACCTRC
jgi:hypothetical protein